MPKKKIYIYVCVYIYIYIYIPGDVTSQRTGVCQNHPSPQLYP